MADVIKVYFQNATTGKFNAYWTETDPDGTVRLCLDPIEYDSAPVYVPVVGTPLISKEQYMVVLRQTTLGCTDQEWTLAAKAVSYAVEKYLGREYRADSLAIPEGLETTVANMVKMRLAINTGARDLTKKSESITNYSYTNADIVDMPSLIAYFAGELDTFRDGTKFIYIPEKSDVNQ